MGSEKVSIQQYDSGLSNDVLMALEQEHGSSFYLFNVNKLQNNYEKMKKAFADKYENFVIGYSYKTNYLPYLCKVLKEQGAYAEVVSRLEYVLAIKIGQDPKKIIFNGPLKNKDDIFQALRNESLLNIDSIYELQAVKEYCNLHPTKDVKIGLRLNFDLTMDGESPLVEGHKLSRFGLCVENGEMEEAFYECSLMKNLRIVGLLGHFSTSKREVKTFEKITRFLCRTAKEHLQYEAIEYIDVGGGLFGEVPKQLISDTPTFEEYAESICGVMNEEFSHWKNKPVLMIEPGISLVANTFQFAAKVIGMKHIRTEKFILVDGSAYNIKPTFHKKNLPMKLLRKDELSRMHGSFHIVGYTCLEKDYLAMDVQGGMPKIGDYFLFENVGAYSIVFNPPFIKERPAILALKEGQEMFVVRKKETFEEFFGSSLHPIYTIGNEA